MRLVVNVCTCGNLRTNWRSVPSVMGFSMAPFLLYSNYFSSQWDFPTAKICRHSFYVTRQQTTRFTITYGIHTSSPNSQNMVFGFVNRAIQTISLSEVEAKEWLALPYQLLTLSSFCKASLVCVSSFHTSSRRVVWLRLDLIPHHERRESR